MTSPDGTSVATVRDDTATVPREALGRLFLRFLRFGCLAWGGPVAQSAMIREELVEEEKWVSPEHFNRVLAVYQVLPAPLIIFSTFVGYVGGGPLGALLMTLGIFFPAFAFTLWGHDHLEGLLHHPRLRLFLDGVTAGVVGLISATTVGLLRASLTGWIPLLVFAVALAALFKWKSKQVVPLVVAGAAGVGFVAQLR